MQNQVEVRQSQEPVVIDEIVPGSVQQIENSLIGISAVSGMVVVLARFRQPVKQVASAPTANGAAKRKPGRPAGQPNRPVVSPPAEASQPTIQ